MRAGAGGQITASGETAHGTHIDVLVAPERILYGVAGLGERRGIQNDEVPPAFVFLVFCECAEHIHLKCKKCGQILHLEDEEAEKNLVAAMEKCHFKVDEAQSLIVGVCEKCGE